MNKKNEQKKREKTARHFVTDLGVLGLVQILYKFRGLILLPIIAKGLGAAAYGVWTQFFVTVSILSSVAGIQLQTALVRYVSDLSSREDQQEYFYSLFFIVAGVALLGGVSISFFADALAGVILAPEYVNLMVLMGPFVVTDALNNLIKNMFRALLQIKKFAFLDTSLQFTRLTLAALILYFRQDLELAVFAVLLAQATWMLVSLGMVVRIIGFRWPRFCYLRETFSFSGPLIPTYYSAMILKFSDRFIINFFLGPAAVGVYNASYNIAQTLTQFYKPIRSALFPVISRLWDADRREEAGQYLSYSLKYFLLLTIPAIVGLVALGPTLLALIATPEFASVGRVVLPIIALGIVMNTLESFLGSVLRLHEKTKDLAFGVIISAVIHLALNLVIIPLYGLVGAAFSTLLGYAIQLGLIWWAAWRHGSFPLPVRAVVVSLMASVGMLPVVMWLNQGSKSDIFIAAAAGGVIYVAFLLLLGGIEAREWVFFRQIILRRRKVKKMVS